MSKFKQEEKSVLTTHELKELIKGCRLEFVRDSFSELAELHTTKSEISTLLEWNGPDKANRLKQLLRIWPRFNVGDIVWAMSPSPIPDNLTGETEDDTSVNGLNRNILIDLIDMRQRVDGQSYNIGLTMVKMSSPETKPRYLCADENDRQPYIVHIREDSESGMHFIMASFDERKDVIWSANNIDEFAMLSEINAGADGKRTKGSKAYIFTCFNQRLGVLFTEVLPGRKNVKLSLDSIEGMEFNEPLTGLSDACFYYLKNKDMPFAEEQKYFFVNYRPFKPAGVYSNEHIAKILSFSEKLNQKKG